MSPSKTLAITYTAQAQGVLATQSAIDRGNAKLEGQVGKTGGAFSKQFGNIMPAAAAAAGAAVIKFGVDAVNAYREADQMAAQTNARIESTGGAANVTAEDVATLAQRIAELSGADDEAIVAGENMLLTFTRIRNEVGAGNDIFDQATMAVADMATAMNNGAIPAAEQMSKTSITVGKALNDPIRGLTALSRVGVTFTDQQREQITAMVEAGDIMGAQKVILGELEREFGGAAKAAGETFGGQLARLGVRIEEVQESLGRALAPAIIEVGESLADFVETLEPAITVIGQGLAVVMDEAAESAEALMGPIRTLTDLLPDASEATDGWSFSLGGLFQGIVTLADLPKQFTDPIGRWQEAFHEVTGTTDEATEATEEQIGVVAFLEDAFRSAAATAMDSLVPALDEEIITHREARDAAREQRLAMLALTDSFVGILDSGAAVAEAQRELNRLERQGKEDTRAYDQAVQDAIISQAGLEQAVLDYAVELAESGDTQREVERKVRNLAGQFGIQESAVDDLIDRVLAYIRALLNVPDTVTTRFTTDYVQHGQPPGPRPAAAGFHGMVASPTLFLAGEGAGSERVDITPEAMMWGAQGFESVPELRIPETFEKIDVIVEDVAQRVADNDDALEEFESALGSATAAVEALEEGAAGAARILQRIRDTNALARDVRDELVRIGRRNVTSGLES